MNDQERLKELRRILYNEIKSELSYQEKKEFSQECCEPGLMARLLEKSHKRKKNFSVFVVFYAIFIMVLLILFLIRAESLVMIFLITLAIIFLPVLVVNIFTNKSFLGYQKLDLVLRLITKFYVKKE